jgi:serine protease Do
MVKKVAAIAGGVLIGIVFTLAHAGAFPFWGNGDQSAQASSAPSVQPSVTAKPAAPNAPEPNERGGVIGSFAPLVKRVMPAVVNVAVTQDIKVSGMPSGPGPGGDEPESGDENGPQGQDPFEQFRRFFGQNMPREYKQHGLGSGVIVSPDGYILTNNHVVGNAEDIHVTLMDKREFTAKVIGKDPKTDLALIKIDSKEPLPVAPLGDSNYAEVGDWVIAIGNPFGFSLTVTAGIVSAKGRILGGDYDDFIQTDASINPGNSGGPLFNSTGQVIGINSVIYSKTGTNNGIGFAIPIDLARTVMDQLKAHGRVVRGWLGVEIQEVTNDLAQSFGLEKATGALIAGVDKEGPAAKGGIERGDVVLKFNARDVHDEHELPGLVAQAPINKSIPVEVVRNGKHINLNVTIGERKESPVQTARAEEPGGSWGMQVGDVTPDIARELHLEPATKGVVIRKVAPDSPAAEAALRPGDIVLEIDHDKVATVDDFVAKAKSAKTSGKSVLLLVQRGGATIYTVVKPPEKAKG